MTFTEVQKTVQTLGLDVIGVVEGTILLLGPNAVFWDIFQNSAEYQDGKADPIDRWSLRVITQLAERLHATPEFPFGGPPYAPFLDWALKSGRAWQSPVGMLVHDQLGLMVSFRGALRFADAIDAPLSDAERPCDSCIDRPCLTACPVGALTAEGYDTASCADHLRVKEGAACLNGCLVRRACPYSEGAHRQDAQNQLHMKAFLGER